jgi:hypothetical protein
MLNHLQKPIITLGAVALCSALFAVPAFTAFNAATPKYLTTSASDESFDGPGNEAVKVMPGLKVELFSDQVGVWADMIAPYPTNAEPTHLFIAIEQRADGYPTAETRESVQVVDLKTKEVKTVAYGLLAADGIRITPWGSVLITEEESDGQAWEILDPLNVLDAQIDRVAKKSDNPNVVYRGALGTFAWEGIGITNEGVVYAGDELRPDNDADGGAIFKFVPETPWDGSTAITAENSPFASGALKALSLGAGTTKDANGNVTNRDYGQGTQTGYGEWLEITNPDDARAEADKIGATGYYRPEDLHIDTTSKGAIRLYWANTGNAKAAYYGEVMVMVDIEGKKPLVQFFAIGDGQIAQPDNLEIHPKTGDVFVIEDFAHGDIWVCKKDGADAGSLTDRCGRILSVRDPLSEPTGFVLVGDGDTAFVHLQHRDGTDNETEGRQNDDLLMITGINSILP